MDFSELKKAAQEQLAIPGADFVKDNDDSLSVGHIEINATQKLIFSVSTFKGKKYFDIRNWIQAESGDWTPTKKGIHLAFDKFAEFENTVKLFAQIIQLDK